MIFIQAGIGLALLLFCADFLVRGAVGLARQFGISTLMIGLTVVACGTSAPEFVTALAAALRGNEGMAVGNVVGSNIANMMLILGIAAAIRPIVCSTRVIQRDAVILLAATLVFVAIALFAVIDRWQGVILVACLLVYLYSSYRLELREPAADAVHVREAEEVTGVPSRAWKSGALVVAGLVGIVIGAELLVRGGIGIAELAGVSDAVIGLTLIAVGTSLPELATVVVASLRGHGDVALGNVLGSNIFNLLAIAGGVAIVEPLSIPGEILQFDLWVMAAITALLWPLMITGRRLSRGEGWLLAGLYVVYIALQFVGVR